MDQASQLRSLMLRAARQAADELATPPRMVVIAAGRSGAGCTTIAVNLAVTYASQGARTVLVDANLTSGDIADRCQIESSAGIVEVLGLKYDIHEVLALGPCGVQVVTCTTPLRGDIDHKGVQRLLKQLRSLSRYADVVIVDAGTDRTQLATGLWAAADDLLLATTPDPVAVMDSYAMVKSLVAKRHVTSRLGLVVNNVDSAADANDVHRRIDQSCARFLGLRLPLAGWIEGSDQPLLLRTLAGQSASRIEQLVEHLEQLADSTTQVLRAA